MANIFEHQARELFCRGTRMGHQSSHANSFSASCSPAVFMLLHRVDVFLNNAGSSLISVPPYAG